MIDKDLGPGHEGECTEGLRLGLDRDVEILYRQHDGLPMFALLPYLDHFVCPHRNHGYAKSTSLATIYRSITCITYRPQEHHEPGHPVCVFVLPIVPYLR